MGRRYSASGDQNAGTNATVIGLTSATTIRPELFEFEIGSGANAPADLTSLLHIERFTSNGASSAFTPIAVHPGDPSALAAIGFNHTGEPAYTANAILYKLPLNQRVTFRWLVAAGSGFKSPATAGRGVGLQFQSSGGTAIHEAIFLFEE